MKIYMASTRKVLMYFSKNKNQLDYNPNKPFHYIEIRTIRTDLEGKLISCLWKSNSTDDATEEF